MTMKKVFSVFALMMGIVSVATAQTSGNNSDLFEGCTKKITYDVMLASTLPSGSRLDRRSSPSSEGDMLSSRCCSFNKIVIPFIAL